MEAIVGTRDEQFGEYQLRQRIAVGGMAEIFLAQRCRPGGFAKVVAVKRVLPELARQEEFRKMFADEARLCASLNHPGLVQVFDYGEVEGVPFLVMEWVDGYDLATLVNGGDPLPFEAAALVAAEICRSLASVHDTRDEKGQPLHIVHRDLSPGNVLISRAGDVKLGDFGVAQARGRSAKTDAGTLTGTLAYLSPEQVSGDRVDRRTDVYAVGLLLFELLTGDRYIQGDSEIQLLRAAKEPPARKATSLRRDLDPAFDAVLARALSIAPEARHQDAGALEQDLRRLCTDSTRARELLIGRLDRIIGEGATRRHTNVMVAEKATLGERLRLALRRSSWRRIWIPAIGLAALLTLVGVWTAWEPQTVSDDTREPRIAAISSEPPIAAAPPVTNEPPDLPPVAATIAPSVPSEGPSQPEPPLEPEPDAETKARPDSIRLPPPLRPSTPQVEVAPEPSEPRQPAVVEPALDDGPSPADLLREADRMRGSRGVRPGDDRDIDTLRNRAAALALRGGSPTEARRAIDDYRQRIGEISIDQGFVDRKMRRATRAIEAAQPTIEQSSRLEALSQQALSSALSRDYEGANRILNRIFDLLR
jgi:hypothetical protein